MLHRTHIMLRLSYCETPKLARDSKQRPHHFPSDKLSKYLLNEVESARAVVTNYLLHLQFSIIIVLQSEKEDHVVPSLPILC